LKKNGVSPVKRFTTSIHEDNEPLKTPTSKGKITARQKQVLEFVRNFIQRDGFPPTVRDIASCLKIVSLNAVRRHLLALEKKGYLRLEPGKSRGIQLLDELEQSSIEPEDWKKIPIMGKVAAGPLATAEQDIEGYVSIDPDFWGSNDEMFFLRIDGDSMYPRMEEGDLVMVRRQSYAEPGNLVVALENDEATVKQLINRDGKYFLHPINSAYNDIELNSSFSINGVVIGLIRKI
jgi:repressor LexA